MGTGIHSTALAIMLERKTLPGFTKPDWAIFADIQSESPYTYDHLDWLQPLLSFPIIRTSWGDLRANTEKALQDKPLPERGHHKAGYIDLPVFSDTGLARR